MEIILYAMGIAGVLAVIVEVLIWIFPRLPFDKH